MATVADRKVIAALMSAARGVEESNLSGEERTNGFLVTLYDLFYPQYGNTAFPAGRLNKKIAVRMVRGIFDVGETPANRNLSDKEVLGSRLPSQGFIELNGHPNYTVRLTEAGIRRAEELIASCEV